jgi:hypothetical protein
LRESDQFARVYISPDLTEKERKQELELKANLKKAREESEKNGDGRGWMIKKGKVVSVDQH